MKNVQINCRNCYFKFKLEGDHSEKFSIGHANDDNHIDASVLFSKVSKEIAICPCCAGGVLEVVKVAKAIWAAEGYKYINK